MKYIKCKETKINKESEHSDHCEDEGKINGLLYLPALGIISNFVGGILALYMLSSFSINIFKSFGTITTQGFFYYY